MAEAMEPMLGSHDDDYPDHGTRCDQDSASGHDFDNNGEGNSATAFWTANLPRANPEGSKPGSRRLS